MVKVWKASICQRGVPITGVSVPQRISSGPKPSSRFPISTAYLAGSVSISRANEPSSA